MPPLRKAIKLPLAFLSASTGIARMARVSNAASIPSTKTRRIGKVLRSRCRRDCLSLTAAEAPQMAPLTDRFMRLCSLPQACSPESRGGVLQPLARIARSAASSECGAQLRLRPLQTGASLTRALALDGLDTAPAILMFGVIVEFSAARRAALSAWARSPAAVARPTPAHSDSAWGAGTVGIAAAASGGGAAAATDLPLGGAGSCPRRKLRQRRRRCRGERDLAAPLEQAVLTPILCLLVFPL